MSEYDKSGSRVMGGVKHTPGPWEVRFTDEIYAGGMNIADAWCYDIGSPEQAVANAHLIAAAPEMKEALEEARTTLSVTRTNIMVEMKRSEGAAYRFEGVPEILKARIDAIDAAIAKANGE